MKFDFFCCFCFFVHTYPTAENMDKEVRPLSPIKRNKKGQMVHRRERMMIVNLYKDLKAEDPRITKRAAHAILSKKTGFGIFSIKNTLLQYESTGTVTLPNRKKNRISNNQLVDEIVRNSIRKKVHQFYVNKELPTLRKVLKATNNDSNLPNFKRTTFWKLLKELNFTYVTRHRNSILTERDDLILWRRNYLRDIKKFRAQRRPIYYLDETWVDVGKIPQKMSIKTETIIVKVKSEEDVSSPALSAGSSNPSEKGKRLIALHIGSTAGFVPGGLLCFESVKNTADCHDEINGEMFLGWFERILPLLEDNAVIVMDNAPCHSVELENLPNASWSKAEIIAWLKSKGKAGDTSLLKAELLSIVSLVKDNLYKYVIDEKAKEHNKTVLRLPPYHCELNPMEMVWSIVKGFVKGRDLTVDINDMKRFVEEGVERVTPGNWTKSVKYVMEEEENLWEFDDIADQLIDDVLPSTVDVNACYSDSETDWSD